MSQLPDLKAVEKKLAYRMLRAPLMHVRRETLLHISDRGDVCPICLEKLVEGPPPDKDGGLASSACIIACPCSQKHVFHTICFLGSFRERQECPTCRADCRWAFRQLLTGPPGPASGGRTPGVLECLGILPIDDIQCIFNTLGLLSSEYGLMAKRLAGKDADCLKRLQAYVADVVAWRFSRTDFIQHASEQAGSSIPNTIFSARMVRCFINGLSVPQVLSVFRIIVRDSRQSASVCSERLYSFFLHISFIPRIALGEDAVHEMIYWLLECDRPGFIMHLIRYRECFRSASHGRITELIERYIDKCTLDPLTFEYLWLTITGGQKLGPQQLLQIRRSIDERLRMRGIANGTMIVGAIERSQDDGTDASLLSYATGRSVPNLSNALDISAISGMLGTIINAPRQKLGLIFRSMLENWDASYLLSFHYALPASLFSFDVDRRIIERSVLLDDRFTIDHILVNTVRRHYFGFAEFIAVFDLIALCRVEGGTVCDTLLIAANGDIFKVLEDPVQMMMLFNKFVDAEFFWGVAFLGKYFAGIESYQHILDQNLSSIMTISARMSIRFLEYMEKYHRDSPVVVLHYRYFAAFLKACLDVYTDPLLPELVQLIMGMSSSDQFGRHVDEKCVSSIVRLLDKRDARGLECLDAIFIAIRSTKLKICLKEEIYKVWSKKKLKDSDMKKMCKARAGLFSTGKGGRAQ